MKILALEQEVPDKTSADFAPYLQAEAGHVWELYKEGIIRERYFDEDNHTAVLMLECVEWG